MEIYSDYIMNSFTYLLAEGKYDSKGFINDSRGKNKPRQSNKIINFKINTLIDLWEIVKLAVRDIESELEQKMDIA